MAAPWGRPPTNFEQLAAKFPVPLLYRSRDGGRTWQEQGRMKLEWKLTGMISDGGITFLRLQDGRLALLALVNLNLTCPGINSRSPPAGNAPIFIISQVFTD